MLSKIDGDDGRFENKGVCPPRGAIASTSKVLVIDKLGRVYVFVVRFLDNLGHQSQCALNSVAHNDAV